LSAPVDLAQSIWGVDGNVWDALSSLLNQCCDNDVFFSDLLIGHEIHEDCDLHDVWQDAVLKHLLNGTCVSASSPLCRILRHSSKFTVHLAYTLCTLLLATCQEKMIDLKILSLCCTSVGLDTTTIYL